MFTVTLKGIDNDMQSFKLALSNNSVSIAPVLHGKDDNVYYSVE